MSAPSLSALSLLPALSVVLGLPLCNGHASSPSSSSYAVAGDGCGNSNSASAGHDGQGTTSSESVETSSISQSHHQQPQLRYQADFAERAKSNASRIYARRVINRTRLERSHPWASAAASDGSSSTATGKGGHAADATRLHKSSPSSLSSWKDELLSETLLSLIRLEEQIKKMKPFTNNSEGNQISDVQTILPSFGSNKNKFKLLGQLSIKTNNNNFLDNLSVAFPNNSTTTKLAFCESSKQRTLNEYNSLEPSNGNNDKPAEWSDDIDLVQRRLEFGQEISPLSNTTRMERWTMATKRMVTLGMLVAPLSVMVPINLLLGNLAGKPPPVAVDGRNGDTEIVEAAQHHNNLSALQRYHQNLTQSTWDYALWAIETAGPTYIKLVQWASTRNDLFSPEFVGHFSKLQDETRGHTWRETEATLERAYGKDWRNILSFDREINDEDDESDGVEGGRLKRKGGMANRERQKRLERNETRSNNQKASTNKALPTIPIGSGCVAQVYKARLCSSHGLHPAGTSVAVKVQHPNILEKVCLDFYIMNKVASLLEYIPYLNLDYLSMKDSVDQFRDIMLPQLDLRVEAHNLQRFRRDFEGESQIAFPEPLVNLTSREVLVERFVEGEPMLNFVLREDEHHSRKDREELATIGLETVMKMIFLHDFIHADLHPGNMIVDRNKSVRGNPIRVHMIDCGLTVELGERDHMNLVKILGSLIKRDGYSAGKLMVDTAKKCQATELDVEMFCNGIEKICVDDEENNFLESVGDYITDICYLACKHKVKLEAAFINAALACEIMEGLASSLYPDMQVQSVALPMVLKAEMMHGLKGLPNPRLWSLK